MQVLNRRLRVYVTFRSYSSTTKGNRSDSLLKLTISALKNDHLHLTVSVPPCVFTVFERSVRHKLTFFALKW